MADSDVESSPLEPDGSRILVTEKESHRRYLKERLVEKFFQLNGFLAVLILFGIMGFLFYTAWPAVSEIGLTEILFGTRWNPSSPLEAGYGAASLIISSLMITVGCLLLAIPWGIAVAAYLGDVASPKVREILKPVVEVLAIFPSVVIGFVALVFLAPLLAEVFGTSSGLNALTGTIALSIMALPTIISVSEDAITAVSSESRQAAYALGATKWQTVRYVVIPAALSGIIAAVMLGFGRAIGETMTVLMATGNSVTLPLTEGPFGLVLPDFLASIRALTATIASEGLEVPWGSIHWHSLFVLGAILFILTFLVNLVADLILQNYGEGEGV